MSLSLTYSLISSYVLGWIKFMRRVIILDALIAKVGIWNGNGMENIYK